MYTLAGPVTVVLLASSQHLHFVGIRAHRGDTCLGRVVFCACMLCSNVHSFQRATPPPSGDAQRAFTYFFERPRKVLRNSCFSLARVCFETVARSTTYIGSQGYNESVVVHTKWPGRASEELLRTPVLLSENFTTCVEDSVLSPSAVSPLRM